MMSDASVGAQQEALLSAHIALVSQSLIWEELEPQLQLVSAFALRLPCPFPASNLPTLCASPTQVVTPGLPFPFPSPSSFSYARAHGSHAVFPAQQE
jgi:hypothetical protein